MSFAAPPSISMLVSHGDPLVHAGLVAAIRSDPRFCAIEVPPGEIVGRVCSQGRAMPLILVTDYDLGIELLQQLDARSRGNRVSVMVVTSRDRESDVQRALSLGARAYLMASCTFEELSDSLHSVSAGRRYLCRVAGQRVADGVFHTRLTARELEVLQCLALGYANKVIARDLRLSVGTVKSHMRSLMGKLGVASRMQVMLEADRRGLVHPTVVSTVRSGAASDAFAAAKAAAVSADSDVR